MTEEMLELGRRAVACKGWRWMPGMLPIKQPGQIGECRVTEAELCFGKAPWSPPDLTDPATLGCLLALVREAWPENVYVMPHPNFWGWRVVRESALVTGDLEVCHAKTEVGALVAALEAAP